MIGYFLLALSLLTVLLLWQRLRTLFGLFRVALPDTASESLSELPSVSLCIPARNEDHAMTACLENALLSRYPKLEIIVLDDGSRDKTAHIIRSFAQSGVRFIEGSQLPQGWLGKNHALDMLAREASGSLVLFADVDTRFSIESVSQMVAYMQQESADMISVLPARGNPRRASALFATYRNFWNIIGHTKQHPAAASSAWMIRRDVLMNEFHGLEDVSLDVRPERSLATQLSARDAYRFIISSGRFGVTYEKKLSSQYETAMRVYYPDFGIQGTLLRSLATLLVLVPYGSVVIGLVMQQWAYAATCFGVTIVISLLNAWYLGVLRSNSYGVASICLPFLLMRELYLLFASIVLYRSGKITWKNRPVRTT